jgi:hypothetical protein
LQENSSAVPGIVFFSIRIHLQAAGIVVDSGGLFFSRILCRQMKKTVIFKGG